MTSVADGPVTDPGEFEALLRRMAAAPPIEPAPELVPLKLGTVVGESYRVDARIGAGGMGVVYRATDLALGRPVALKLHRHRPDPDRLDRLMREAGVMARLSHPNVLTIYEVGHHRGGPEDEPRLFVAMEYVDGGSVVDWAHARRRGVRAVLDVFLQAGEGLAAAHAAGVVHRDFKPDNVLIDARGRVRVADFGLARLGSEQMTRTVEPARSHHSFSTRDGAVVGTPAYMAPEQWDGQPGTPASDQYAFCVSFYEVLYEENPLAALRKVGPLAEGGPRWAPLANRAGRGRILRSLRRGLAEHPAARFDDMQALLAALRHEPWRRPKQIGGVALVAAISGGAAWHQRQAPQVHCDGGRARLSGVWDEPTRTRVAEAFETTALSYAADAWTRTEAHLDAHAATWVAAHRETCEATVQGSQSAELMDLRMDCLADRLASLAAMVEVLSTPDEAVIRNAPQAASGLPSLARCRDVRALREVRAIPEDRAEAAGLVVAQIARAHANLGAGHPTVAQQIAERAVAEAAELAVPHLDARARYVWGRALGSARRWDAASAQLQASLAAAVRARDDEAAVSAVVSLVMVEGVKLRAPGAERWVPIAEAWVERLARQPDEQAQQRANLDAARGLVARDDGRFAQAVEHFERALSTTHDPLGRIRYRGMLSETHRRAGDLDAAVAMLDDLQRDAEAAFGATHPEFAQEVNNAGSVRTQQGRFVDAQAQFQRSLEIRTAAFGPKHPAVAESRFNLGIVAQFQGHHDAAVEHLRAALEASEESVDPETKATILGGLGALLAEMERHDEAVAYLEQSVAVADRNYDPGTPATVKPRHNLAVIEARLGNDERAYALADAALKAIETAGSEDVRATMLLHALRGKLAAPTDPEAALVDLEAALRLMDGAQFDEHPYRFDPLRTLGDVLLALGRPTEALERLRAAEAAVTPAVEPEDVGKLHLLLARARLATGDQAGAHADAVEARALVSSSATDLVEAADALVDRTR